MGHVIKCQVGIRIGSRSDYRGPVTHIRVVGGGGSKHVNGVCKVATLRDPFAPALHLSVGMSDSSMTDN